jgi:hypothetical protein
MENQTVPVVTPQVVVEPKGNNFLVILLSILLFISVVIAGFFAYQTQNLVKELSLRDDRSNVDTSTIEITPPTISPMSTSNPAIDSVANWKTYINNSSNYQIKYPTTWKAVNFGLMEAKPADTDTKNVRLSYQPDISKTEMGLSIEESGVVMASQDIKFDKTKTIGTEVAKCGTTSDLMTTFCWLTVSRQSKFLTFTISNYQDSEVNKTIDQILSTFKFTN